MAHKENQRWPEKKKIEAVTTYLALGKLPFVAQVTGVNYETLRHWKKQEWWMEMEDLVRTEENQELDSKLSKIVNKSLDVVVDRLEHGDFTIDKLGKVHRVPVKLRDASKVSTDLLDKRSLIRKEPVRQVAEKQESINERLLSLAEQFAAIALGKDPTKTEKVIEGEILENEVQIEDNPTDLPTMQQEITTKSIHLTEGEEYPLHQNEVQELLCWKSTDQNKEEP